MPQQRSRGHFDSADAAAVAAWRWWPEHSHIAKRRHETATNVTAYNAHINPALRVPSTVDIKTKNNGLNQKALISYIKHHHS